MDYNDPKQLGGYLSGLIDKFDQSEDSTRTARENAERDVDYYDGKQWTDKEAETLRKRGQPIIAHNMIKPRIDFLRGLERSQRSDPVALPRTPSHEEEAHAATDALRYVDDAAHYDGTRSDVWSDMLKAGWGGVEVVAEPSASGEYDIAIRRCPWDRMFWDPASGANDFSDAAYLGLVVWMDREQAIRTYGADAAPVFDETVATSSVGNTYDDKPKLARWVDKARQRVRVIQMYHVGDDGQWRLCEFTRGGILRAMVSPWLDENQEPTHPYVWRSLHVDRENNRYGAVRMLVDPQDETNKRRSKFLHLINARQTFGVKGMVGENVLDLRKEMARPDGHVSMEPGSEFGKHFGVIPTGDMATGQFQLLQQTMQDLAQMGPNAAMMGRGASSASGRSVIAQQQGGIIEADPSLDEIRSMDLFVYRAAWNRVRQFWTAEKWVRVTDDENNLKWVGINVPVTDELGQVVQVQNQIAGLDVDIIIADAPDTPTLQGEQFAELASLAQAGVVFPPEIYIRASNLRNKSELMRVLQEQSQPPQQDPAMAEMQMRGVNAEIADKEAGAMQKAASARKTNAEANTVEAQQMALLAQISGPAAVPGPLMQ